MQPEALEDLHRQNIEALDGIYADLLKLAKQGTPEAKEKLREIAELRARITGDTRRLREQMQEIALLSPSK